MKKRLIIAMMSFLALGGGLTFLSNHKVKAKAATKLPTPFEVDSTLPESRGFHSGNGDDAGDLEYRWEIFTLGYVNEERGISISKLNEVANVEVAFYPTSEGFDPEKEYPIVTETHEEVMPSSKIINAFRSFYATSGIEYSPAFRYVSKSDDYEDSDWWFKEEMTDNFKHLYTFDFAIDKINEGGFHLDSETGKLVWPSGEVFNEEDVTGFEILVYSGELTEVDEDTPVLASFILTSPMNLTKELIEAHLGEEGLEEASYRFSARLIVKEESHYDNSHLYKLTEAFTYSPVSLSEANIALNCNVRTSYPHEEKNLTDGNTGSQWAHGTNEEVEAYRDGWIILDLGSRRFIKKSIIFWEGAYADNYQLYVEEDVDFANFAGSTDNMIPVANETRTGHIEKDEVFLNNASGRYLIIKFHGGTPWATKIFEIELFQDPDLTETDKFLLDWKELRDLGNKNGSANMEDPSLATNGICYFKDNTWAREQMIRLLDIYDHQFSEEERAIIDAATDVGDVKVGETINFLRDYYEELFNPVNDNDVSHFGSLIRENNSTESSIVSILVVLGIATLTTVGYYFYNRRKYNN